MKPDVIELPALPLPGQLGLPGIKSDVPPAKDLTVSTVADDGGDTKWDGAFDSEGAG